MRHLIFTLLSTLLLFNINRCTVETSDCCHEQPERGRFIVIDGSKILDSLELIDGFNIFHITYPSDTLELLPVDDGYMVYSFINDEPFPIDMLYTEDVQSFVWWLNQYPLEPTDSNLENPNSYYQELLLEKIYE